MKCMRCGKEMVNTIGGNYHCDECGFGINDLVYRGGKGLSVDDVFEPIQAETTESSGTLSSNTATTTTDGLATPSNIGKVIIPNESKINDRGADCTPTVTNTDKATIPDWSNHGFVQQGWQCPKCGAILSPSTSFCPFCSRGTWTPTVTCGYSGEFVNPNVSTSISKEEKND